MTSTFEDMASFLIEGYWDFSETRGRRGPRQFEDMDLTYYWSDLQNSDRLLVEEALQHWSDVSGLSFTVTDSKQEADIVLRNGTKKNQAWAWSKLDTNSAPEADIITKSTVTVSTNWTPIKGIIDGPEDFLGSYRYGTFVHEIGHALGLGHQGKYNGGSPRPKQILFDEDTLQYSVMSYNEHPHIPVGRTGDTTTMPGLVDILAMQEIYGTSAISNPGDTVYGHLSTASQAGYDADYLRTTMMTIYDTGGDHDRLNFRGTLKDQSISLIAGEFSDVYGRKSNVVIAFGVVIEEAIGGSGDDHITGNATANLLRGRHGGDTLDGGNGADRLFGQAGADHLVGGDGDDQLVGGRNNDTLTGGDGNDTFIFRGNFGHDTIIDFETGGDIFEFARATIDATTSFVDGADFHLHFTGGLASITLEDLDILAHTPSLTASEVIDAIL